ncbi:cytochrome b/b6 domain-containing protein [Ancylomarina longa]|uniref:PAS domain S-box protein n=1 Tax=Ancylomarina longa TaxID=2487017 RepID=A0A434AZ97_9BACT|nr:cytochrome b/b6 domain-containing protein [Ancylomarina longa]RUT79949.1 PAS domain S-box protein [Ancylomarina longa]
MKKVYIYKIFERFWHWAQALLILILMISGFEIHSSFNLLGYGTAVKIHDFAAWAFLVLIIFAIFWHFTTGEWKQYIPTTKYLKAQFDYYVVGIFRGAPHPTKKLVYNKFNPLQRLIYLGLKVLVIPIQVISGFLYLYFHYPIKGLELQSLDLVAVIHTFGAFLLLAFMIAHVYLTTTGYKPMSAIKAMITGWEEMSEEEIKERLVSDIETSILKSRAQLKSTEDYNELFDAAISSVGKKAGITSLADPRFKDAIENSGAGYFFIGKDGIYNDVNETWYKLYKYDSKDEIIGKHYRLSRTEEDFAELEAHVGIVLKTGQIINHGEVKRICKDGSIGYHTLTISPVYKEDKIVGIEGFIIDTTGQLLAERELLKKQIRIDEEFKKRKSKED